MPAPDADYRELAGSLPPVAVSQYLAATGDWTLETRQAGVREIWASRPARLSDPDRPEHPGDGSCFPWPPISWTSGSISGMPSAPWPRSTTGHRCSWSARSCPHADLFLVRLDQEHAGESIPLRQAETTVEPSTRCSAPRR